MSSHYAILCLNHDPAILVGWDEEWHGPETPLSVVADRTDPRIAEHKTCRLLVGRYSYPLVEVCCPRSRSSGDGHAGYHPHNDHWVDAGWLRLLALSTEEQRKLAGRTDCWTFEVAWSLRHQLNIEDDRLAIAERRQT